MISLTMHPETADIETSSDDYATRFAGNVGAWFLEIQAAATLEMLKPYPQATILDVGGGHGQLTETLLNHNYRVTVFGSDPVCKNRIAHFVDEGRCAFDVGNLVGLPYADQSFDVVVSYRLLPHVTQWPKLIAELARVARQAVIIDYPEIQSINYIAPYLFQFKKKLEGNTRTYTCFRESQVMAEFEANGFKLVDRYSEFLLPMVLHRKLKSVPVSARLEAMGRYVGLTDKFGSPVIIKVTRKE